MWHTPLGAKRNLVICIELEKNHLREGLTVESKKYSEGREKSGI
jgi:hypothetical protein